MAHEVAIQVLEEELELINAILNYYEINRVQLRAQGFSITDASYRHWAVNKAKLMVKKIQLQSTISYLRDEEKL